MSKPDDSGPAFPNPGTSATGMTLRVYLAAKFFRPVPLLLSGQSHDGLTRDAQIKRCVSDAFSYADEFLKARSSDGP